LRCSSRTCSASSGNGPSTVMPGTTSRIGGRGIYRDPMLNLAQPMTGPPGPA
jgi:hypothetical protein